MTPKEEKGITRDTPQPFTKGHQSHTFLEEENELPTGTQITNPHFNEVFDSHLCAPNPEAEQLKAAGESPVRQGVQTEKLQINSSPATL